MRQGEVRWAEMPEPRGSGPGYRRPVVVVQSDPFNRSGLCTVLCVVLTTNLRLVAAPGNVMLPAAETGLGRDSVANVTQVATLDRDDLSEPSGRLGSAPLEQILRGIRLVLGCA